MTGSGDNMDSVTQAGARVAEVSDTQCSLPLCTLFVAESIPLSQSSWKYSTSIKVIYYLSVCAYCQRERIRKESHR